MIKVSKKDYINFYQIFSELGSYTFFLSSLDGIVKGDLYADDAKNPTYALMLTADLYYLAGDLSSEICKKELYTLSQSDVFLDRTGFIFANKNTSRVKEIFSEHTHTFIERENYQLVKADYVDKRVSLSHCEFVTFTPDTISNYENYKNYKDVYDECFFYWDEYPKDSAIRFAKAIVKENTILSFSYVCGESSSENSFELGIETFDGYQRNGYAEAVCRETMKELFKIGFKVLNWHCHADNIASKKTAKKLGFKQVEDSHLAWFRKTL